MTKIVREEREVAPMRILHVSDLHGTLPKIAGEWDVMCNTGDWMPTKGRRMGEMIRPHAEIQYQCGWIYRERMAIKEWLGGRPMIFVPGNHDFYDPIPALRDAGIDAIDANEKLVELEGLTFYGIPHIPWHPHYDGAPEWCRQVREEQIAERVALIPRHLDVLMTHAPPAGILDAEGERSYGSTAIRDGLLYEAWRRPRLHLFGHVHRANGVMTWLGTTVSNAATGARLIEIHVSGKSGGKDWTSDEMIVTPLTLERGLNDPWPKDLK